MRMFLCEKAGSAKWNPCDDATRVNSREGGVCVILDTLVPAHVSTVRARAGISIQHNVFYTFHRYDS